MDNNSYQTYSYDDNIFKKLIEESPSPVGLYVGRDMVIKLVNRSILRVWDKDDSVVGKTFVEALPEIKGQGFLELLQGVYDTGIPYEAKAAEVHLFVDGQLRTYYFNFTYSPIKDDQGQVWGVLNTAEDVTELVLTRQKLAAIEERTRFALESAEVGTWDLDPVNDLVTWDDRCKQLFGFTAGEEVISYTSVLRYMHPDDQARIDGEVQRSLDPNGSGNYDVKLRTVGAEDGLIRWLRCRGKAYFDDEGRCIRFAGTAIDISKEIKDEEEQRKLLTLVDSTSDFISLSDVDGNVSYVNMAGKAMLGITDDENVRRHNSEFLQPEDAIKLREVINKGLFEHGRWTGNVNFKHFETGEVIPVNGTTMLVNDPLTGEPQGRATIVRDMRREIADRSALEASERFLQNITSASPTALWMSDDKGLITYANRTWADWTGQSNEDMLGTGWLHCIVEEDRQRAADKFMRDLVAQRPYEVDFRIHGRNGEIKWCLATGNPQYNEAGDFVGYIGACTDVSEKTIIDTELQLKNAELNDQISQFEFVTDFMPVQLWTAKLNGELDYVNRQATDYFGTSAEDLSGNGWMDFIHPDDRDAALSAWQNALQGANIYQMEFRLRDDKGVYKWHLSRALPFVSEGKTIKWFGTNTDIEEQKQLQRQKDEFLGIASHELKTPVTSVKAYAQVLGAMLRKEGDEKKASMVEKIDSQLNRLTNLIGDLLDVTKINSGRIQFNKTHFDLSSAVKETVADLQHTTQRHELILQAGHTGEIFADKERIGQVVTNLVTNAIKYSPNADKIIITTEKKNREVVVCVQDFGIGIPHDKQHKVFEQFYRVSGSKQHTFPGLGLGLYISSEIIKREGGKLWVNSVEGKGSTFCFSIPAGDGI